MPPLGISTVSPGLVGSSVDRPPCSPRRRGRSTKWWCIRRLCRRDASTPSRRDNNRRSTGRAGRWGCAWKLMLTVSPFTSSPLITSINSALGALARQILAGPLVLGDADARHRLDADQRHQIALRSEAALSTSAPAERARAPPHETESTGRKAQGGAWDLLEGLMSLLSRVRRHKGAVEPVQGGHRSMVNIYLFIELLHTASAVATVDTLKALQMHNCKFANVVVLVGGEARGAARLQGLDRRRQGAAEPRSPRSTAWCRPTSSPWSARRSAIVNARLPNCRLSGRRPSAAR